MSRRVQVADAETVTEPRERWRQKPQNRLNRLQLLPPALICLASLLVLAYFSSWHPYGTYTTETDFYHYYSPDAQRIAARQFPENPYQGPGYPALLALAATVTGDLFVAGKWISIVSVAAVGLFTFMLFARLFGYFVGVGAQLLVLVGTQLPVFALNATTDAFFLMLCLATLVVLIGDRLPPVWRLSLSAVLVSLAYLTRYNGLFLLVSGLVAVLVFNLFERPWRGRVKLAALFVAVFLVTTSPWFYYNFKNRGSALYNTNYLNIATQFYPELAKDSVFQDGTRRLAEMFHSFGDVLMHDPARLAVGYSENLYESLERSVTKDLVNEGVGWIAVIGLLLALIERRSKQLLVVLTSTAICVLLLSLTHWETRYYFFVMAVYSGLAVYALARPLELLRVRGYATHRAFSLVPVALFAVLWSFAFSDSRRELFRFLSTHPTGIIDACDYLKSRNVTGAKIVARKPHLPAMCGSEWIFFPQV